VLVITTGCTENDYKILSMCTQECNMHKLYIVKTVVHIAKNFSRAFIYIFAHFRILASGLCSVSARVIILLNVHNSMTVSFSTSNYNYN